MPTLMNNAKIKAEPVIDKISDNYVMTVNKHYVSAVRALADSLGLITNVSDPHLDDVLIYTTGSIDAKLLKTHFEKLYGKI